MKGVTTVRENPAQCIQNELSTLRLRAEAAARSANVLMHLILAHKTTLVSGATMLYETATLLQHSAQNFQLVSTSAIGPQASSKDTH